MMNTSMHENEDEYHFGQDHADIAADVDLLDYLKIYSVEAQRRIAAYLRQNLRAVRTLADSAAIHEYNARELRMAAESVIEGREALNEDMFAPYGDSKTYPQFCEGYALRYMRDVLVALDTLTPNGGAEE